MTADSRDDIEAKSKELEDKSGIQRGVDGIISVLDGDLAEWQPKAALRVDDIRTGDLRALFMFLFIVTLIVVVVWQNVRSGHYVVRRGRRIFVPAGHSSSSSTWSSSDSSSSSSSDSDFSGGGGASGELVMKRFSTRLTIAVLFLGLMPAVVFALDFPPLTGRVVDQAGDERGEPERH